MMSVASAFAMERERAEINFTTPNARPATMSQIWPRTACECPLWCASCVGKIASLQAGAGTQSQTCDNFPLASPYIQCITDALEHERGIQMTERQLQWAASHDWYIGVSPSGKVVCVDEYTKDGVNYRDVIAFTDFAEMRAWAGY
jgi:hypothetical protein